MKVKIQMLWNVFFLVEWKGKETIVFYKKLENKMYVIILPPFWKNSTKLDKPAKKTNSEFRFYEFFQINSIAKCSLFLYVSTSQ